MVLGLLVSGESPRLRNNLECEKFSSLDRLLTITVLVLRLCWLLISKIRPEEALNTQDLRAEAERLWILDN